jgi:hypothetical protein
MPQHIAESLRLSEGDVEISGGSASGFFCSRLAGKPKAYRSVRSQSHSR